MQMLSVTFDAPGHGKRECDRSFGHIKNHFVRVVSNGTDITTDKEMVSAFAMYGGIKDNYVACIDTSDFETIEISTNDIPAITNYYHFTYEKGSSVTYRKYYKIGQGKSVGLNRKDLKNALRFISLSQPTINWQESKKESQPIPDPNAPKQRILNQEFSWTDFKPEFKTTTATEKTNLDINLTRLIYVKDLQLPLMNSHATNMYSQETTEQHEEIHSKTKDRWDFSSMGFAMKATKTLAKITPPHKEILDELYREGELSRKYTPEEAVMIIRNRVNKDGKKIFRPNEWLTATQIKGYWARKKRLQTPDFQSQSGSQSQTGSQDQDSRMHDDDWDDDSNSRQNDLEKILLDIQKDSTPDHVELVDLHPEPTATMEEPINPKAGDTTEMPEMPVKPKTEEKTKNQEKASGIQETYELPEVMPDQKKKRTKSHVDTKSKKARKQEEDKSIPPSPNMPRCGTCTEQNPQTECYSCKAKIHFKCQAFNKNNKTAKWIKCKNCFKTKQSQAKRHIPGLRQKNLCVECRDGATDIICSMCKAELHTICAKNHGERQLCQNCEVLYAQEGSDIEEQLQSQTMIGRQDEEIVEYPIKAQDMTSVTKTRSMKRRSTWAVPKWNSNGSASYKGNHVQISILNTCR